MSDTSPYEIAGTATRSDLGRALTVIGESVLRADRLRVLGKPRRSLSFPQRVILEASENDLAVLPKAKLHTRRGGEREVTCKVTGADDQWTFVLALSAGGQGNESYDHARSVFGDADENRKRLITVVADGARLQPWQEITLDDVSKVVRESNQAEVWRQFATAS